MAIAAALSYTPEVNCRVVLSACFDAESGQPSDFGINCGYRISVDQDLTQQSSTVCRIARARARYSMEFTAELTANVPAYFYLILLAGASVTTWNLVFKAEVIKL